MNVEYETMKHIEEVKKALNQIVIHLLLKGEKHDRSKFSEEELPSFLKYTPLLADTTYGSKQYKVFLKEMKPALKHHYKNNEHHPEYHKKGIRGMNLLDIIEMLCDWKAATKRHKNGDIRLSIIKNQKRFGYSDELKEIFLNTMSYLI